MRLAPYAGTGDINCDIDAPPYGKSCWVEGSAVHRAGTDVYEAWTYIPPCCPESRARFGASPDNAPPGTTIRAAYFLHPGHICMWFETSYYNPYDKYPERAGGPFPEAVPAKSQELCFTLYRDGPAAGHIDLD